MVKSPQTSSKQKRTLGKYKFLKEYNNKLQMLSLEKKIQFHKKLKILFLFNVLMIPFTCGLSLVVLVLSTLISSHRFNKDQAYLFSLQAENYLDFKSKYEVFKFDTEE